jgi:hypothetical protein
MWGWIFWSSSYRLQTLIITKRTWQNGKRLLPPIPFVTTITSDMNNTHNETAGSVCCHLLILFWTSTNIWLQTKVLNGTLGCLCWHILISSSLTQMSMQVNNIMTKQEPFSRMYSIRSVYIGFASLGLQATYWSFIICSTYVSSSLKFLDIKGIFTKQSYFSLRKNFVCTTEIVK